MHKVLKVMLTTILLTLVFNGCTKGYESQKTAGDVTVTLSAASYPLVKGDNTLIIKVSDAAGKAVTDAKVDIRYYMPAMPGMAPMEYTTQATPQGSTYTFNANIPMEGGWKTNVTVSRMDKTAQVATFNVDAR